MLPRDELMVKAAALARSSRTDWEAFVAAFRNYAAHTRDQMVAAPVDQLQITQGQARAMKDTQHLLEVCIQESDKLAARAGPKN